MIIDPNSELVFKNVTNLETTFISNDNSATKKKNKQELKMDSATILSAVEKKKMVFRERPEEDFKKHT